MVYFYRWQYCDMDFLRHCLKQYSLLLEKIPSAILTEETTGTQMFVTGFLSDCIKRCDDGFDDYTMTVLLPKGKTTITLQTDGRTIRHVFTRYHGKHAALLPEMAAYYFSKAGRQRRRDTEQAMESRCFAFFDYAYNRMLETQFLRHDFRWVGGEIPSVNHLKTLSDAADLTEALGQFRREEYGRRKKHDLSHAKLCTFLETQFGILYFENRSASYLLQPVSGGFSADDGSTESWLLWRCNRLLGGIALTAERKVCRLFGTDENDRQQVLAAYFCFCRQKGILFSGEMQLCQPEYPEPLGKDFLPWKWESGKVTPQLLQTIADQLRQCAPEQAADWCWLLGTRLVFTVLPLAKEALAALPQLERDAFFVQAGNGDCLRRPAAAADGAELRKTDGTVRQAFASRFQGKAAAVCPPVSHIGMHQVSDTAEKWLCLAAGATSTAISKSCLRRHHPAGNPQRTAVETVAIAAGKNCSGTGLSPLL